MLTQEWYVGGIERRAQRRYPVTIHLEYKLIEPGGAVRTGSGRTVNISNSGLLFQSESPLPPETKIELTILLPHRLDQTGGLRLQIAGRVQRAQDNCIAVRFDGRCVEIEPNTKSEEQTPNTVDLP